MLSKSSPLTSLTIIVTLVIAFFIIFTNENWKQQGAVVTGDAKVYYTYLPAALIHGDLTLDNLDPYFYDGYQAIWVNETEDGKRYIKGTYGMALMYSPFFLMGHAMAAITGEAMDGYSYPYRLFLNFSGLFYLLFGLIFLSKLLRRYFEDHVVSITLLVLVLGTNVLFYTTDHSMYTHAPTFMLFSILLYGSAKWFETHRWKWTIIIGLCGALMTLIRPIDFIFVLFLPLIGLTSIQSFKERLKEIWQKRWHFVVIGIIFVIVFTPQFIYNYSISKSIFFYSYSNETFFFDNPHIWKILVGYRNGWLVYSPLMLFSLVGVYFLYKQRKEWTVFVVVAFIVYLYVISSWWCWWYVGFGNRAFINLYPILALPLAAFIQFMVSKGRFVRFSFKMLILLGLYVSVFQTYQFHQGYLHWSDMTKEAYWDAFMNVNPSQMYQTYLEPVVIDRQQKGDNCVYRNRVKTLGRTSFSFDTAESVDSTLMRFWDQSKGAIYIPKGDEFAGNVQLLPHEDANEIYLTAWVKEDEWDSTFLVLNYAELGHSQTSYEILKIEGDKAKIHCRLAIPDDARGKYVSAYFWNLNRKPLTCYELTATYRKRTNYIHCED